MKQMIVVRKDLNMRKGKMVAQGAHASLGAILPHYRRLGRAGDGWDEANEPYTHPCVEAWLAGPFKKVCVGVTSEEELQTVHDQAEQAGLIVCMITDSGLTEFNGVPTKTCCAVGPATDEDLDPITGSLTLL